MQSNLENVNDQKVPLKFIKCRKKERKISKLIHTVPGVPLPNIDTWIPVAISHLHNLYTAALDYFDQKSQNHKHPIHLKKKL